MTLDRYPMNVFSPYSRVGATINAAAGLTIVVALALYLNPSFLVMLPIEIFFGFILFRSWRGDFDNAYTREVMRNPFAPSRRRTHLREVLQPGGRTHETAETQSGQDTRSLP